MAFAKDVRILEWPSLVSVFHSGGALQHDSERERLQCFSQPASLINIEEDKGGRSGGCQGSGQI